MADYSWYSNTVNSDPDQRFQLNVSFEDGVFSWNVVAAINDPSWDGSTRNSIFGLKVEVGGNTYNRGDISWQNYSPNTVVYSGTTNLSSCTVESGAVRFKLSGNYWYGTWNSAYTCSINQTVVITAPTVSWPSTPYTITKPYGQSTIVSGISSLNFTMNATPGTAGNTISTYKIFVDGTEMYSGASNTCTIIAPGGGTHSVYFKAIESNGAEGISSSLSISVESYTFPAFISTTSLRWSSGSSSGHESDDGQYAAMSASFSDGSIGLTPISAKCDVVISSFEGTIYISGDTVYTDSAILSADISYTVTYKLYDDYIGVDYAIERSDIIAIGRRGVEIVFDETDGYGVAVGMKATPEEVGLAFPLKIVKLNSSGNIIKKSILGPEPETISQVNITRTSGLQISSAELHVYGRVAMLSVRFTGSGTYNVGDNVFVGAFDSRTEYEPIGSVMGTGYYGDAVLTGWINSLGAITVRLSGYASSYTFSDYITVTWTYIF